MPSSGNDRQVKYGLVELFDSDGLWDQATAGSGSPT